MGDGIVTNTNLCATCPGDSGGQPCVTNTTFNFSPQKQLAPRPSRNGEYLRITKFTPGASTFKSPINRADATITAYSGMNNQNWAGRVVLPQAFRHALSEERGHDGIRMESVVRDQHVLLPSCDVQLHLFPANVQGPRERLNNQIK